MHMADFCADPEDESPSLECSFARSDYAAADICSSQAQDIRHVAQHVHCATSRQLQEDYKHMNAVCNTWGRPAGPLRAQPQQHKPHMPRPDINISQLWAAGLEAGRLSQQQQQRRQQLATFTQLPASKSIADFYAAKEAQRACRGGALQRISSTGALGSSSNSSLPCVQTLAQDVRATASSTGRPLSPLVLRCLLEAKASTSQLDLPEQRQAPSSPQVSPAHQQLQARAGNSPPAMLGLLGSPTAAASTPSRPCMPTSTRPGSTPLLQELSLWAEPRNVSPVAGERPCTAASGSPAAEATACTPHAPWPSPEQQERPHTPTVLALFATERNIAPALVAGAGGCCSNDCSPSTVTRGRSISPGLAGRSSTARSCSPVAYSAGVRPTGRVRSCSPEPQHLVCCSCRRQHTMTQHKSCCHLCSSCRTARGTCSSSAGSAAWGGSMQLKAGPMVLSSSMHTARSPVNNIAPVGPAACAAHAACMLREGHHQQLCAEDSAVSAASTCPCIRAYKKGQQDALEALGAKKASLGIVSVSSGGVAAASAAVPAGAPVGLDRDTLTQLQPSHLSAAAPMPAAAAARGAPPAAAAAAAVAQVPEDLVQTAFLEVYAAQQNLLSQGPTADPLDIEQLSHILQQVLPAAQPQHEALLQDVLARQQQLLAMQDACLAELEGVGASIPTLKLPVAFCQQRPSAPPTGISVDSASSAQAAQARQYKHQESQQWVDGFTPRTNSTSSNSLVSAPVRQHAPTGLGSNSTCHDAGSAGGQAGVFRTAEDLQKLMSQEDRLAVAAAAYGSYDCPQKSQQQLLEASRGKAGARSGRGRGASAASTVEVYTGQLISPTGGRQHGAVYVLDDGLDPAGFEGGAAPAYAADSSSGSEVDVQCRPLLSYMNVQETAGSSHSAHARLQQTSPAAAAAATNSRASTGTVVTAARTPSSRSIADSAWSVQAVPGASIRCSTAINAATEPQLQPAHAAAAQADLQEANAAAGAGVGAMMQSAGHWQHSSSNRRRSAVSAPSAASGSTTPRSQQPGSSSHAMQTVMHAERAEAAVWDPRQRIADSESFAACCLQELAAAIASDRTAHQQGYGPHSSQAAANNVQSRLGPEPGRQAQGMGGTCIVSQADAGGRSAAACAAGVQLAVPLSPRTCCLSSAGGMHSPRVSVRFQYEGTGAASATAAQHQQQWQQSAMQPLVGTTAVAAQQQQQQSNGSVGVRAGSFEHPDSSPTSGDNSRRPSQEGRLTPQHSTPKQQHPANGAPQGSAASVQDVARDRVVNPAACSPRGSVLQDSGPQHRACHVGSIRCSTPAAAAAAAVLARHTIRQSCASPATSQMQSPFSSCLQSPRTSLVAAAAVAAAVVAATQQPDSTTSTGVLSGRASGLHCALQPGVAEGVRAVVSSSSRRSAAPTPSQQQQLGSTDPAASAPLSSAPSWQERQTALQQQLAEQQQQLARIRSRASSVGATPKAHSMLRSMSRASEHSNSDSVTTTPRHASDAPHMLQQQSAAVSAHVSQQQQQAGSQPSSATPSKLSHAGPGSEPEASAQGVRSTEMCERVLRCRRMALMWRVLQGWQQHTRARKHKTSAQTDAGDCSSTPRSQQQPQQGSNPAAFAAAADNNCRGDAASNAAGSSGLCVSLQAIDRPALMESIWQLLQGSGAEESGSGALDILVSGQVRLQPSPTRTSPPKQLAATVAMPAAVSSPSSASPDHSRSRRHTSETIRHFDTQLHATRAAVAAAAAAAGRAPLQGVLQDMQHMVARMEAACGPDTDIDGSVAVSAAATASGSAAASPGRSVPQQYPQLQRRQSTQSHSVTRAGAQPVQLSCSTRRPGSAGSCGLWQQQQRPAVAQSQPCSPAFVRSRSPQRQQHSSPPGKLRSPDCHKLRRRLHQVQDRLAKVEVKMQQVASMNEPCGCGAASPRAHEQAVWGSSSQGGSGSPPSRASVWAFRNACSCMLQQKRGVLVDKMQQELESLQLELSQLQCMMPGAYTTGS